MAARGRPKDEAARERIVAAGTELFARDGYVGTTIGAIAAQAQVAVKTIYSAYGNKLGVLAAAHDHAVLGDTESARLLDHDWVRGLSDARSVHEAWGEAATRLAASTARSAPLLTVLNSAAADPDVATYLADLRRHRHAFTLGLARILLDLPGAGPRRLTSRVADVLYATMTAESYTLFVTERGWSLDEWRDWAHGAVARELTPDSPTETSG